MKDYDVPYLLKIKDDELKMSKEQLMFLKLSPKSKEALDRSGLLFSHLVFPTLDMFEKSG